VTRDSVPSITALRRRSADARGFALVEAVAASAIFALIVLGVLAGIDGAAGSSGREKARSVAGSLAEQDQERMRGMRAIDLSNYSQTRTVEVPAGGAQYTVRSDADWIRDNTGGTISCTNSSTQADYLRIRSTVTSSTVGTRTAPVTIDSLVAPPVGALGANQGTLAVQVNNRDAVGVSNIVVKIANGTTTRTETTNELGCAVFAYIPVGTYDVNVNQAGGWVNPLGVTDVHTSGNVSTGTTNVTTLVYDVAGTVTANVRTRLYDPGQDKIVDSPSRAFELSAANAGMTPGTGIRTFPENVTATVPSDTFTAAKLFPFKDSYGFFTGYCTKQNPPSGSTQIVDRAGIYTIDVYQPALRVQVKTNSGSGGTPVAGAHVTATYNTSQACAPNDVMPGIRTDPANGLTTQAQGWVTRAGGPFDPGLPYGSWVICADNGSSRGTATVNNNALAGPATTTTIGLTTSGRCP
jgi:hypothetical protein